ncbi:hypothetical protein EPO04_03625 [Patescibacteria group bacterium]|nr:MAG: hypothetical protein EPO04_03625 [Patescibacteria group bacterium]
MAEQPRFKVKVFSPYQTFYKGTALSLSAQNATGPFDVLFNHGNFFTLISPGIVRVDTGYDTVEIEVTRGIMRVADNNVTLFANV